MVNSINYKNLPTRDLLYTALIIFVMSTIISNIYNPLWGVIYAFANIITLAFLGWLYQDSWSDPTK